MSKTVIKACLLIVIILSGCARIYAQMPAMIPWSSTINQTFGNGTTNPGSLISAYTDFTFTTDPNPAPGFYSVIYSNRDAGHIYYGPFPLNNVATGYKMIASYNGFFTSKILYSDTARNLCGNSKYLFWAGLNNANPGSCLDPNLTFSVETLAGTVIASFQTGDVGLLTSNYSWFPGYYDPTRMPAVPFYGGIFQLPVGVTDVVVKIITNPSTAPLPQCSAILEIDNIILMPVGPDIRISSEKYPGGYIAASCFEGDVPLELQGMIDTAYLDFGTPNRILDSYTNPAFQWQQSLDEGYTWTDLPGETNIDISHVFNNPDTFWVRLLVAEAQNIANRNCGNASNVIKVMVDGKPTDFSLTTNSPVCTDGDLLLTVSGGASFNTYGPNGFFDNSPHPHIYHPALSDSGWYYSEIISFGGCKGVDSEFVKIIGPDLKVSPDRAICYGDTVHLYATGGIVYNWTPVATLNNAIVSNPVASPTATTRYEVKVSDNSGCSAYGNVTLTLRNPVLKAIINGPPIVCPGDPIIFRDTSIGQITNWSWEFGNGNTSNLQNPGAQYYPVTDGNFFTVNLSVTDTSGCVQKGKRIIQSVNNCFITVPTAFTPNNDGLNDFLHPLNAYKATHLLFRVFDRWGQLVFETRDWTRKWDGTVRGVPQATGVYIWMLTYTDEYQKPVFIKGTTALIR